VEDAQVLAWTVVPVLLGLVYFLSVGPVARAYRGRSVPAAVEHIYSPIVWLHGNTPLHDPIEGYTEMWLDF
jgi:hypothetical protein